MALWQQILDTGKQVLALTRTVDRHTDEIAELRSELTDLRRDFEAVLEALRDMRYEQLLDRELAAKDRENLLLRLENTLLRHGQRLPPETHGEETER